MSVKNILLVVLALAALTGWVAYARKRTDVPVINLTDNTASASASIMQALQVRSSTLRPDFTTDPLTENELLALSWAASGKNRDGHGYTIPLALASDPYVDVYIFDANGTRRYDWEANTLAPVTDTDARQQIVKMGELATIPDMMVFVIDPDKLPVINPDESYGYIAVGAMSQNVYLLAAELGIQRRYIASIDADAIKSTLSLDENDIPVGAIMLAKNH